MWGVQIIATKCLDHYTQLQLILNHSIGENLQNLFFFGGGPSEDKKALLEVPRRFLQMDVSICAIIVYNDQGISLR